MGEAMRDQVLERAQQQRGERNAIILIHPENLFGGLERFFALRIADFGKDDAGDESGGVADFDGHGARKLERKPCVETGKCILFVVKGLLSVGTSR